MRLKLNKFEFERGNSGNVIEGTLFYIKPDENTRYIYEIRFPYTLEYINKIKEGIFLAVKNFASKENEYHYSILEVAYIHPYHYAVSNISGNPYPQFAEQAIRNASLDWETQKDRPEVPTTKIIVKAIPTNLEVVERSNNGNAEYILQEEENIPMLGKEVYVLDKDTTERIINKGLLDKYCIDAGNWIIESDVKVKINVEELLRKHFGIFGYTGAGKSNLVSTLVRKIIEFGQDSDEKVKIVIWDLASEYYGLLLDILYKFDDAYLIALGDKTFPESVLEFFKTNDTNKLDKAVKDFVNTMVFPKEIKNQEDIYPAKVIDVTKELFLKKKIRILAPEYTLGQILSKYSPLKGRLPGYKPYRIISSALNDIVESLKNEMQVENIEDINVTQDIAEKLLNLLNEKLKQKEVKEFEKDFEELRKFLEKMASGSIKRYFEFEITTTEIINILNDRNKTSLLIFVSHDPDDMRITAYDIGSTLYEYRRRHGLISPIVSFIFDEADEFIPRDIERSAESYRLSSSIAMTIARRGRKFGIGIGISTQRICYLNTNIMAQPHTYFVSKLPRRSDRETVAEAFGLNLDIFNQTFKFKKGDWLVVSHDALGMESVPVLVHFENANKRIIEFLKNFQNEGVENNNA